MTLQQTFFSRLFIIINRRLQPWVNSNSHCQILGLLYTELIRTHGQSLGLPRAEPVSDDDSFFRMFVHGAPLQRSYLWSECADWSHFEQVVEQLTCCAFGAQRSRVMDFSKRYSLDLAFHMVFGLLCLIYLLLSVPNCLSPTSPSFCYHTMLVCRLYDVPNTYKYIAPSWCVDQKRGNCLPWNVDTFTAGQDILYSYGPQTLLTVFIKPFLLPCYEPLHLNLPLHFIIFVPTLILSS